MMHTNTISDTILDIPPPFTPTGFYCEKGWKSVSKKDIEHLFEILEGDLYTLFILEKLYDSKELYFSAKFKDTLDRLSVDIEIFKKTNIYTPNLTLKNIKTELFYNDKTWFIFDIKSMSFVMLSDDHQLLIDESMPLLTYTVNQF